MSDSPSFEQLFLDNLPLIERVAASLARRQGLGGDDAADFTSWVKLRLVESDYEAFRRFRGESSLSTYLTVVVTMLARDYRVQRLGRWRPSATARRKGAVAVRLELLVHRQGYPLRQAAELLRASGETELSDTELARLFASLPAREPLRPIPAGEAPLAGAAAGPGTGADVLVDIAEGERERRRAMELLEREMRSMSTEDRVILRLRFWEGLGVADIARGLRLEQKPLYRRLDRLLVQLRQALVRGGIGAAQVQELLEEKAS